MELADKTVIVVGLGRSGVAAASACLGVGARVVGVDAAPRAALSAAAVALEGRGASLVAGGYAAAPWASAQLVVVSPGVAPFAELDRVAARGVEVISELELGYRSVAPTLTVAIGGTNGKSTTTSLVAAMCERAGFATFAGGNLGTPLCEAIGKRWDRLVLEVSSYQAERIPTFAPRVAALLNVTDDHLDRYSGFAAYAAAKGNMFVQQTDEDVAVVPFGDVVCAREAARGSARVVTFGVGGDVGPSGDSIVDRMRGARFPLASLRIAGAHNVANACAAIACAAEASVPESAIAEALAAFEGLAHRTALVGEVAGVRYYDDSKGTNVGAAVAALTGLDEARAVLIAGGRDKLGDYAPLVSALRARGRALVVLGEAAPRIEAAARGAVETSRASSMADAVRRAHALALPGDAVLLSPACSSFDMFRDYKQRGEAFVAEVRALTAEAT